MTPAGDAAWHRSSASGPADQRRLLEANGSDRRGGGRSRGSPDKTTAGCCGWMALWRPARSRSTPLDRSRLDRSRRCAWFVPGDSGRVASADVAFLSDTCNGKRAGYGRSSRHGGPFGLSRIWLEAAPPLGGQVPASLTRTAQHLQIVRRPSNWCGVIIKGLREGP